MAKSTICSVITSHDYVIEDQLIGHLDPSKFTASADLDS